jgi:hypothetical protein
VFSVVIPVYRNEESLPELVEALASVAGRVSSSSRSSSWWTAAPISRSGCCRLPRAPFRSQVVALWNFGAAAAIRADRGREGWAFGVVAAACGRERS